MLVPVTWLLNSYSLYPVRLVSLLHTYSSLIVPYMARRGDAILADIESTFV